MFNKIAVYLKNFDWVLFAAVMLLISFGLAELYSIALGQSDPDLLNFKKQIAFVFIGLVLLFLLSFIDYYTLRNFNRYFYIIAILLLVGVLLFGKEVRGTRGWYDLGNFSLQPVEFVKIFLIIFLARYFSSNSMAIKPLKHLFLSGLGAAIFAILVLRQPDFGSAMILVLLWLSMVVISGIKIRYIIGIFAVLFVSFIIGWYSFFEDYQKERILTFFNPSTNSLDQGYNISQAIIAIGAGGEMGRGIGFGSQSQLKFLPEAENDFIFAVISEELGFLGVILISFFFSVIFVRLLRVIKKVNNDFGVFLLLGIGTLIFIEMFINIGMNIGILPVIGISLPFLSYGGSALISTLIMVGIAESVIIRAKLKY